MRGRLLYSQDQEFGLFRLCGRHPRSLPECWGQVTYRTKEQLSACSASAEVAARFIVCSNSPKARFSYLLMNYPLKRCNRWVLPGFMLWLTRSLVARYSSGSSSVCLDWPEIHWRKWKLLFSFVFLFFHWGDSLNVNAMLLKPFLGNVSGPVPVSALCRNQILQHAGVTHPCP